MAGVWLSIIFAVLIAVPVGIAVGRTTDVVLDWFGFDGERLTVDRDLPFDRDVR